MKKYTVYIIRHISTWTVLYVGKTNDFKRRAYEHLKLRTKTKKWLSSIGTGNVLIEAVAEFENKDDALKYEDELILKYNTITNGYNNNRSGLIASENPKGYNINYQREYRQIEEHKEYQRKYQKKYHKTDEYRAYVREYHRTDKYINYQKEYRNTDEHKEYQKNYQIDYRQAKKIGITIDEYRKFKQNKKQPIQLTINF